ncbi:MAG TPA: nitroreductase/quinone reductase family protein [Solirubrobacterales bacterium]
MTRIVRSSVEPIASGEFKDALEDRSEVELTVTGRKSGRESSRPVWFVQEGERLLLLPINGTDTSWYRNIVKTPEIRLAADGAEFRVTAKPIEDAAAVSDTVERFGAKYGAERVQEYYPKQDAAVEVPLS